MIRNFDGTQTWNPPSFLAPPSLSPTRQRKVQPVVTQAENLKAQTEVEIRKIQDATNQLLAQQRDELSHLITLK